MDGMRARDADRDRFVDLIEAAYADGQLGAQDRELRVSRALTAETLDELRSLTRDLQAPPGAVVPHVAAAAPARLTVQLVAFIALVVLLLGAGVSGLIAFAGGGGSDSATSSGVAVEVESAPAQPQVVEPFSLDRRGLARFVRAYGSTFGRSDVRQAVIRPDRVEVEVPVGSRGRIERWVWDGEWRQVSGSSSSTASSLGVDLRAVDIGRLVANVATAERTVGIDHAAFAFMTVTSESETPEIDIYVRNDRGEVGYLRTTPSGDVVGTYRIRW